MQNIQNIESFTNVARQTNPVLLPGQLAPPSGKLDMLSILRQVKQDMAQ